MSNTKITFPNLLHNFFHNQEQKLHAPDTTSNEQAI